MEGIVDSQELLVRYVSRAWREGEGEGGGGPPSDENGSIASVVICGGVLVEEGVARG